MVKAHQNTMARRTVRKKGDEATAALPLSQPRNIVARSDHAAAVVVWQAPMSHPPSARLQERPSTQFMLKR